MKKLINNAKIAGAVQQAVPADRFARKIAPVLKSSHTARSRRLNGRPLERNKQTSTKFPFWITLNLLTSSRSI
jgi:hypothetical protein